MVIFVHHSKYRLVFLLIYREFLLVLLIRLGIDQDPRLAGVLLRLVGLNLP